MQEVFSRTSREQLWGQREQPFGIVGGVISPFLWHPRRFFNGDICPCFSLEKRLLFFYTLHDRRLLLTFEKCSVSIPENSGTHYLERKMPQMKSDLLKAERIKRGWTQAKVAEAVGVDTKTVGRWERGQGVPYPYFREQLCALFGKTAEQLGLLAVYEDATVDDAASLGVQSTVPDIPTQASFLTDPTIPQSLQSATSLVGRHGVLMEVKERLLAGEDIALTAVDGLPGIGKTALASVLAMDQQVRDHFCDGILWAGLGPRPNVLGHLTRWGMLLGVVPSQVDNIRSREDWGRALRAAIGTRCLLLIIDDACATEDALSLQIGGEACVHLLTTRLPQVASIFAQEKSIFVPQLTEAESLVLLTRFVPELVEQDLQGAQALVQAVGGSPLALTLMGKYLDFTQQPWPLHNSLMEFYDPEKDLEGSTPTLCGQSSAALPNHPSQLAQRHCPL